jgi:hypothetical protein
VIILDTDVVSALMRRTPNVRHFSGPGINLVDPWAAR